MCLFQSPLLGRGGDRATRKVRHLSFDATLIFRFNEAAWLDRRKSTLRNTPHARK